MTSDPTDKVTQLQIRKNSVTTDSVPTKRDLALEVNM